MSETQEQTTVELKTVTEVLQFIDAFDGYGMVSTDEEYQVSRIRELCPFLKDDYKKEYEEEDEDSL